MGKRFLSDISGSSRSISSFKVSRIDNITSKQIKLFVKKSEYIEGLMNLTR